MDYRIYFNGVDTKVTSGVFGTAFGAGGISVEATVNLDTIVGATRVIVGNWDPSALVNGMWRLYMNNNIVSFLYRTGGVTRTIQATNANMKLVAGTTHSIKVQYDGANVIFTTDANTQTVARVDTIYDLSSLVQIGTSISSTAYPFIGYIDNVNIYSDATFGTGAGDLVWSSLIEPDWTDGVTDRLCQNLLSVLDESASGNDATISSSPTGGFWEYYDTDTSTWLLFTNNVYIDAISVQENNIMRKPDIGSIVIQKNKTNGIMKIPTLWNIVVKYEKIEYNKSIPLFYFGGV